MAEVEACEEVVVLPAIDHMELKVKSAEEFRARRVILARDLGHRRDAMANNSLHKTIMAEIGLSMADPRHPLNLNPGLKMNRDIYADMLEYSRERMPHLLDWILGSLTDTSRAIQPEDIGRFGFLISQIIVNSACNTKYCTGMNKIMTNNCRDSGMSRAGLDRLCNMRGNHSD